MLGLMSANFEFSEEELNTVVGWGRIKVGSLTNDLEFFEEELNTGVGWGRGQIIVGVGFGN